MPNLPIEWLCHQLFFSIKYNTASIYFLVCKLTRQSNCSLLHLASLACLLLQVGLHEWNFTHHNHFLTQEPYEVLFNLLVRVRLIPCHCCVACSCEMTYLLHLGFQHFGLCIKHRDILTLCFIYVFANNAPQQTLVLHVHSPIVHSGSCLLEALFKWRVTF